MSFWRPLTYMLFRISPRIAPALRCAIGMPRTNSLRLSRLEPRSMSYSEQASTRSLIDVQMLARVAGFRGRSSL